ncbi:MAG: hypothetical protein MUC92_04695, partial [Fimbriimonadaceae bacterium]|nr:hypothetical protein [Fimbriimonadaceae bacterium]
MANMPHPLSAAFVGWCHKRIDQYMEGAVPPESRPSKRYVSVAGNDTSDGLTPATAWRSLQKVQDFIDSLTIPQAREAAILFRRGDTWFFNTAQGKASRSVALTAASQTANTVTLTSAPVGFEPVPGEMWYLNTSAALAPNEVLSYNSATRVVTFRENCYGASAATMSWETALHINRPVALGAYVDGTVPEASQPRFAHAVRLTNSQWNTTADPKVVSHTLSAGVTLARVKKAKAYNDCAWKVTTEAEVQARENSWAQVGTTVFYRFRIGENPREANVNGAELVVRNFQDGICVADLDGVFVSDIWIDGYGAYGDRNATQMSYPGYGLRATNRGASVLVVRNSLFSNNNRHGVGTVVIGAGGVMVCDDCRSDWNDEGPPFISYASLGANECWLRNCSTKNTAIPIGVTPFNTMGSGFSHGYYAHTSGGANKIGMCVALGFQDGPGEWMAVDTSGWGDAPSWISIRDCRAFNIDYRFEKLPRTPYFDRHTLSSGLT